MQTLHHIYYYLNNNDTGPAWPSTAMEEASEGWYSYNITKYDSAKVMFNDGTNQIPAQNQPGLDAEGVMWYKNGIWCDSETDTDEDELPDYMELVLGTNINSTDSDSDNLPDGYEVMTLGTDPTLADSDSNNISDAAEDADSDGLNNLTEYQLGTNPMVEDSDSDELTDSAEVNTHHTDPTDEDTDGDGANDGWEIAHNTNPLVANTDFDVTVALGFRDDDVAPSVSVEDVTGEQAQSLTIEQETANSYYINDTVGAIGSAYNFSMAGEFDSAEISFEFDSDLLLDPDFDPVIYWFDEEEQELIPLTTTVTGNVASAEVEHFSMYILANQYVVEYSYEWFGNYEKAIDYDSIEMVFVVDELIPSYPVVVRDAVVDIADSLPGGTKVGLVRARGETANALASESGYYYMTDSSLMRTLYNTISYPSGEYMPTNLYTYMDLGLNHFSTNLNADISRVLVVFSGGLIGDGENRTSLIERANSLGVKIITFAIGNNIENIKSNLKSVTDDTMGICYPIENYVSFRNNYSSLVNLYADTDLDGIPDDFEDELPLYNGNIITTDKFSSDSDGDHIKDGEEIKIIYDYYVGYNAVRVTTKFISDPLNTDTDNDGITDDIDTAPLVKGLAGGVVGKLSMVSSRGNSSTAGSSNGFNNFDYGHSFLVYESYVNDTLFIAQTLPGYLWVSDIEEYGLDFNDTYSLSPSYCISFGAWQTMSDGIGNGIGYNCEFNNACQDPKIHADNIALSRDVTNEQLTLLQLKLIIDNFIPYSLISHNCTTVAVTMWNELFNDNLSAKGLYSVWLIDTPAALYDSILSRKGVDSSHIDHPMKLQDKFS